MSPGGQKNQDIFPKVSSSSDCQGCNSRVLPKAELDTVGAQRGGSVDNLFNW